jgi:outer membrane scaffolding protein for murein synthesis (MipA/OmpV family)
MKNILLRTVILALPISLIHPNVSMANPDKPPVNQWNTTAQLMVISKPSYQGDDEYRSVLVPNISVTYGKHFFASFEDGVGYNFINNDSWKLGLSLNYHAGRQEDGDGLLAFTGDDSTDLEGLGDIDGSAEIVGSARYTRGSFTAELTAAQVIGSHDGATATASIQRNGVINLAQKTFSYSVGPSFTVADGNYLRAFYDVNQQQSNLSGLPVYTTKGGGLLSYGVSGSIALPLSEKVYLVAVGEVGGLSTDVSDSSLVSERGDSLQYSTGLALGVNF